MSASLLPPHQLRQVSTGCSSTLNSLLSQNSWHHAAGSQEALLQGETWAKKTCFDPNRAAGKSFHVSALTLERGRKDAVDTRACVKCRPHSKNQNLHESCALKFSQTEGCSTRRWFSTVKHTRNRPGIKTVKRTSQELKLWQILFRLTEEKPASLHTVCTHIKDYPAAVWSYVSTATPPNLWCNSQISFNPLHCNNWIANS